MDSTERRFHLGGALGAAVTQAFLKRSWITRIGRTRAVALTDAGREILRRAGLDSALARLDETPSNDAAG